jgi:hypothetical protein
LLQTAPEVVVSEDVDVVVNQHPHDKPVQDLFKYHKFKTIFTNMNLIWRRYLMKQITTRNQLSPSRKKLTSTALNEHQLEQQADYEHAINELYANFQPGQFFPDVDWENVSAHYS